MRISVYVYWDRAGKLRNYALYAIANLKEVSDSVLVVINGCLLNEDRVKLEKMGVIPYVRENKGYDFGAYRDAILRICEADKYDEILIMNSSVYGPLFPLSEVIGEMQSRHLDFWGITQWYKGNPWPDHLQSYFLFFNRRVVKSLEFKNFFKDLPEILTRSEAIEKGETRLTLFFKKAGFKYGSYISPEFFAKRYPDPTIIYSDELVKLRCPFIKRKVFTENTGDLIIPKDANSLLEVISKESNYDLSYIYDDLINTSEQHLFKSNLVGTHIVPEDWLVADAKDAKAAVVIYVWFLDMVRGWSKILGRTPDNCDIYIISSKRELLEEYKKEFKTERKNIYYRLQPNRGRSESAYYVTCRDVLEKYDFVCLMHDKKMEHMGWSCYGETMLRHQIECLLASKNYICNIFSLFKQNPKIGIIMPIMPFPYKLYQQLPQSFYGNYEVEAKKFLQKIKINVPFDTKPDFPLGGMFWVRKNALNSLFRKDWTYSDFPAEPLKTDGEINHILERVVPVIAQDSGYASISVTNPRYAAEFLEYFKNEYIECHSVTNATRSTIVTYQEFKHVVKYFLTRKIKEYLRLIKF